MPKIINAYKVKTKAVHECYGCGREFPKGFIMDRQSCRTDDNELFTLYLCPTCEHLIDEALEDNEPYEFGSFHDDAVEYEGENGVYELSE